MGASNITVDSNTSGLAVAEEVIGAPTTLPATPTWFPLEPNTYTDFGGQVKTTKRAPINASRQKRKGTLTGLDVNVSIAADFTTKTFYPLMQGFMFANWREKDNLVPTAVTVGAYTVSAGGAAFGVNALLFAEGFGVSTNNGLRVLTTAGTSTTVTAGNTAAEGAPPAAARITRVGVQGAAGDLAITTASGLFQLASTALDFTTLGLIPGEWLFIGGDTSATAFAALANQGWYRIKSVAVNLVVFDRAPDTVTVDAGAAKTVQVFFGHVIKNESTTALQVFRTYQFERQLSATQFQYEKGCGANKFTINVKANDKVTADLAYVGMVEASASVAATGNRPALPKEVLFNSVTSFSRLRLYSDSGAATLSALLMDVKIDIDNGIVGNEAISSKLGKVNLSAGDFTVAGSLTAYFSSLAAIDAVKTNPDCSIDFAMVEVAYGAATGWLFDVPLVTLGDARLKVEKDKPIMLPITLEAAGHSVLNHTMMIVRFAFLPTAAL